MASQENKSEKLKLEIQAGTVVGTAYAHHVGITVTDIDITLEFVYINPRSKKGQVVSRVTLPIQAGDALGNSILATVKEHLKKKGK